jgi:hypothetical protein
MTIGEKKKRFTRIGGQTKREAEIALARLKTEKDELRRAIKAGGGRVTQAFVDFFCALIGTP